MKKKLIILVLSTICNFPIFSQNGIDVPLSLNMLQVEGDISISKDIKLGGNAKVLGDSGVKGQILKSNGLGDAPSWEDISIPNFPTGTSGSLIAIDGVIMVADEISYYMRNDFVYNGSNPSIGSLPVQITNIDGRIIDTNQSLWGGRIRIVETGMYQVTINAQIQYNSRGTTDPLAVLNPGIGLWCDVEDGQRIDKWLARTNDTFIVQEGKESEIQTYSLFTVVELKVGGEYTFRIEPAYYQKDHMLTIKANSTGTTGTGPVSFFSLKRIK